MAGVHPAVGLTGGGGAEAHASGSGIVGHLPHSWEVWGPTTVCEGPHTY